MLEHDWPIPVNVAIAMTNRFGGVSVSPFDSLNLGLHVGDKPQDVFANRAILTQQLSLPAEPIWLEQVHGTKVVDVQTLMPGSAIALADGSYSNQFGHVCTVMTADCLPILLCNQQGTEVAAVHAGWRGLCEGIIEQALAMFHSPPSALIAYLGPAIGPCAFEVGSEVRDAFINKNPQAATHFVQNNAKYLADLVGLAKLRLSTAGVTQIYSADVCTFSEPDYFSYRRDKQTGRMASLIWLKS
ncbi:MULTISPECIES: peptidoglycan editing factor PgeF [unclassified Shewanella]|jgi:YfiH family protein|uniref:peptidoglycan editing factor PgeF n=1 Tax=unclassified Shewanella TaxID=196818 RepID=UPI000C335195|nr:MULTISPECIES: peptidoglycan editing factor PgeF [unclassified Shewanella]MBO1898204.1 peptidoglycan editing factor PgeF [Shewanella sp. BF02_Schw]PKH34867.1 peptidoglycan editing factor PgeF [Shewanella sp. ALD9]